MLTHPALRIRHNSGFDVFYRNTSGSLGIPVVTRGGSARYLRWGGFIDDNKAAELRPAKLAVAAYAECDALLRWIFLEPDQFALGYLGVINGIPTAFAALRDGQPIIKRSPMGPVITCEGCPAYRRGLVA
jgi:hypothetical protein